MGVDVDIYVKAKDSRLQVADLLEYAERLDEGFVREDWYDCVFLTDEVDPGPKGATHCMSLISRYYGVGYERGDWPGISSVLMDMLNDEMINTVWYVADSENEELATPATISAVKATDLFYEKHGTKPYTNREYNYQAEDAIGCFGKSLKELR